MTVSEKDVAAVGVAGLHLALVSGVGGIAEGCITDGGGDSVPHIEQLGRITPSCDFTYPGIAAGTGVIPDEIAIVPLSNKHLAGFPHVGFIGRFG